MIDVHSYSNDLLYPWGDDDDQTTDPSMNFMNTLYDGLRGSSGDNVYREYIPQADLNWYVSTGNRVIDAINAVRSAGYVLKQSIGLYPTSGTSDDYSYSRHYVDSKKKRIYSYTLETGKYTGNPYNDFQPPYSEALNIMTEASAGLIEFCLACLCVVTEVTQGTALMEELEAMRVFREEMLATSAGRRYVRLLEENTPEVLENVMRDSTIRDHALRVLQSVYQVVRTRTDSKPKVFDANVIEMVKSLVEEFYHCGSPRLQKALKVVQQDIRHFENKSAIEGLRLASEAEPVG